MSRTFSMNRGSLGSLDSAKLLERCDGTPNVASYGYTVLVESSVSSVRLRLDRCVLPSGFAASAVLIRAAISFSPVLRKQPGFTRHAVSGSTQG